MIIGVDLDGVLANSIPTYLSHMNKLFGLNLKVEDIGVSRFEYYPGLSKQQMDQFWKSFSRAGGWSKIQPIEGAPGLLERLSIKHKIIVITGRPVQFIRTETEEWLEQQGFRYERLIFSQEKDKFHAGLEEGYKFDIFIEDYLDFASDIARFGVPVLLLDYPWNQCDNLPPNIRRIFSLKEAREIINRMNEDKVKRTLDENL